MKGGWLGPSEGAEALRGRVVRPLLLGDLPEANGEDLVDIPGEPGLKLRFLQPGLQLREGVVEVAELTEVCSRGEAEEARRGEHGPKCEALRVLGDHAAEPTADGRTEDGVEMEGSFGSSLSWHGCLLWEGWRCESLRERWLRGGVSRGAGPRGRARRPFRGVYGDLRGESRSATLRPCSSGRIPGNARGPEQGPRGARMTLVRIEVM